jgi:hypothetical protein
MTIEELLKQQPQLGQGGASQYLYGPQQQYGGAGQYLSGLLSPELNFNAPTGTMPNYSGNTYQPSLSQGPMDIYKMGSLLYGSNNPLFNFIGRDMMSKTPTGNYTFTRA